MANEKNPHKSELKVHKIPILYLSREIPVSALHYML
jgi:hypothetical protein